MGCCSEHLCHLPFAPSSRKICASVVLTLGINSNDVAIATSCQRQLFDVLGADQFFALQRYVELILTELEDFADDGC